MSKVFLYFFVVTLCVGPPFGILYIDAQPAPMCFCDNGHPDFNTFWSSWVSSPECIGGCNNATQSGQQSCDIRYLNGTLFGTIQCARVNACDTCGGLWGDWGNIGACSVGCGTGVQLEQRSCYKRNTPGNVRVRECLGQVNASEQFRNVTCTRRKDCSNPQPSPPDLSTTTVPPSTDTIGNVDTGTPTSIPPTEVVSVETTTTRSMTSSRATTARTKIPNARSSIIAPLRPSPASGVDTVALAAVLGAAAIISVTIVAVAAAIIFLKKKEKTSHIVSYSTSNGDNTVGGVSLGRSNEKSDDHPILPRALYEFDSIDGETILNNGIERQRDSVQSRTPDAPEAVYFTVDDRNKSL